MEGTLMYSKTHSPEHIEQLYTSSSSEEGFLVLLSWFLFLGQVSWTKKNQCRNFVKYFIIHSSLLCNCFIPISHKRLQLLMVMQPRKSNQKGFIGRIQKSYVNILKLSALWKVPGSLISLSWPLQAHLLLPNFLRGGRQKV